jgi:hypothetical protein
MVTGKNTHGGDIVVSERCNLTAVMPVRLFQMVWYTTPVLSGSVKIYDTLCFQIVAPVCCRNGVMPLYCRDGLKSTASAGTTMASHD